jgi:hypothetical protein
MLKTTAVRVKYIWEALQIVLRTSMQPLFFFFWAFLPGCTPPCINRCCSNCFTAVTSTLTNGIMTAGKNGSAMMKLNLHVVDASWYHL